MNAAERSDGCRTAAITEPARTQPPAGTGLPAMARELVAGLVTAPWGQMSPSVYETSRIVSLAPWLTGHRRRVAFLLDSQRPDGGWGLPDGGYGLVPTLGATEALLSDLVRSSETHAADAAVRGLRRARALLTGHAWTSVPGTAAALPDMPAIELIVPSLVELIDRHVRDLAGPLFPADEPLPLPPGMDGAKLALVRELMASGTRPPQKLMHALEIGGPAARGFAQAVPETTGAIGASPAATAAWLGDRPPADPSTPARWYLETVTALHDGLAPVAAPLTVFERGWVLSWLIRAGLPVQAPPQVVLSLTATLGADGMPAAAGLPADADTTAGALYALALLGVPHKPDPLWNYETPTHFCTWQGEDGFSTTTNAHVLEAFGGFLATGFAASGSGGPAGANAARYAASAEKVAAWLRGQQCADGSWTDRWHASPYYATACCALALGRFGGGELSADEIGRARKWVLETQRPDGSWGLWEGTAEETAYAVQTLLRTGAPPEPNVVEAAARGRDMLVRGLSLPDHAHPPLWHDKDLYHPRAIVRAAVLAALHLIEAVRPDRGKE